MDPLADLLEAQFEPLLRRWVSVVAASLAPDVRTTPELADHIPAFLRHIIDALRGPVRLSQSPVDGHSVVGREHGAQRFRLGFELEAVVREYGLLLHILLDLVESTGATVSIHDVRRLIDLVTNAVAEATTEHARRHAEARKTAEMDRERLLAQEVEARRAAESASVEQRRAFQALHRSEENFRVLAEAIPQQVWTATPSGALDFVNRRVVDYFAVSAEEILGAGWQGVIHPDDLAECVARWTHSLATGHDYEVEFRLRRADGAYRWHLGRALASRDERGGVAKWFGTNTDIHEAKTVREELETRTEFEQYLAGIVSHDLRNPLGAIHMGASILLQMEELGDRATKVALRIQSSSERAARMIGDLLDFTEARLGGGIRIERRPSDLYALTSTTVDEVEAAYPERTVDLTRTGDARGHWDSERLTQVALNLVTNALKYSPTGTLVTVHVAGKADAVELVVHNDGPPILPERLGRLFEPLQRASDEIDRKTRSVGLGLYIVNAIVRAHDGDVEVRSTAEVGTTFTVRLPRDPARRPST
jgi:PAS domain S-box-containing protein